MPKKVKRTHGITEENDYLRKIIDSANEGIYVTDRERNFLIWNRAAERITGFLRDEVLGRNCCDNILAHTDGEGTLLCRELCPLEKSMAGSCLSGPHEIFLRHKDGYKIPVEVMTAPLLDREGRVIGGIETFRDISERRNKDNLLKEKKKKLEIVLDNISDGIVFIDNTGTINICNRTILEMFHINEDLTNASIFSLPRESLLRQGIFREDSSFRGPFCWERNNCPEGLDCPQKTLRFCRCWIFGREGSACRDRGTACPDCRQYTEVRSYLEKPRELEIGNRTISAVSSFIEFGDRREIWEVIVFRDVTFEKLDAAVKLATAAAHELRQPLQIIIGAISLLADELGSDEKMKAYCDIVEESCYRMDDIIRKINRLTQYKVMHYADDLRILDLQESSGNEGSDS
ncbi:MAG: PAS domain S-box protein [Nitrospirae bacterium]|nr:PAS domain S-box protein [Nitrospirota bacterium]